MVVLHSKIIAGAGLMAVIAGVHARPAPQVIDSESAVATGSSIPSSSADFATTSDAAVPATTGTAVPTDSAPAPSGTAFVSDTAAAALAANNALAPMASMFDYSKFTETATIPWTNKADPFAGAAGHIRYKLGNGTTISGQVDTGSVGMVVAAGNIPNFDPKSGTEAKMHYVPSDVFELGRHITMDVTFPDINAVATVQVLAVTQKCVCKGCSLEDGYSCNEKAGATKIKKMPTSAPSMIGIGFARGTADLTKPIVNQNPLMALKSINGKPVGDNYNKGFILGRNGITMGLTAQNTKGFENGNMKLTEQDKRGGDSQWLPPRANVKWGSGPWIPSNLLIDTGLGNMITYVPKGYPAGFNLPTSKDPMPANIGPMEVAIGPDPSNPFMSYTFKTASGGAKSTNVNIFDADMTSPAAKSLNLAPNQVYLYSGAKGFVNTGSRPLRGADLMYDAKNGFYALRKIDSLAAASGSTVPAATGTVVAPTFTNAVETAPTADSTATATAEGIVAESTAATVTDAPAA